MSMIASFNPSEAVLGAIAAGTHVDQAKATEQGEIKASPEVPTAAPVEGRGMRQDARELPALTESGRAGERTKRAPWAQGRRGGGQLVSNVHDVFLHIVLNC